MKKTDLLLSCDSIFLLFLLSQSRYYSTLIFSFPQSLFYVLSFFHLCSLQNSVPLYINRSVIPSFVNLYNTTKFKLKINFLGLPMKDFSISVDKAAITAVKDMINKMEKRVSTQKPKQNES